MRINKIILITNNFDGAMLQMTIELLKDLNKMGYDVYAYVPSENNLTVPETVLDRVNYYEFGNNKIIKKINSICPNNWLVRDVIKKIQDRKPDLIWTIDDKPFTCMVGMALSKKTLVYMTIHDYYFHPTYNNTFRNKLYTLIWSYYRKSYIEASTGIVSMSKNGYTQIQKNSEYGPKTLCIQLGAHIPEADPCRPKDLKKSISSGEYNLFFGRIDKYKGIDTLLDTFTEYNGDKDLIIAGSGEMKKEWMETIHKDHRINLINRYIEDSEMIWLIQNANCVVLPYIEASQSGVIPIAYAYNVPVITSNVIGLTQNIENNKTGIICKDKKEYVCAYKTMDDRNQRTNMARYIKYYYTNNFDWVSNLSKLMEAIESH